MRILSWSDPTYFRFLVTLVRSIRETGNQHHIHLALLDFNGDELPKRAFSSDPKVTWEFLSSADQKYAVKNKQEFYRNFRPGFFLDQLLQSQGPILTFGANGVVRSSLDFIENDLKSCDTIFMEREKSVVFDDVKNRQSVKTIEELESLLTDNHQDFFNIINKTTSKIVLLGTHGFANSENSKSLLQAWSKLLDDQDLLNRKFSDMDLFVKAYIDLLRQGRQLKKLTYTEYNRDEHPICDTHLAKGKIWFAKGNLKWNNASYLSEVARLAPEFS